VTFQGKWIGKYTVDFGGEARTWRESALKHEPDAKGRRVLAVSKAVEMVSQRF